jgi:hypothetical protein
MLLKGTLRRDAAEVKLLGASSFKLRSRERGNSGGGAGGDKRGCEVANSLVVLAVHTHIHTAAGVHTSMQMQTQNYVLTSGLTTLAFRQPPK